MRRKGWVAAGALLLAVVLTSFAAWPATSPRIKLGEEIRFTVEDSSTRLWGSCCCCCCEDGLILGWRIVADSEQVIYSVIHDAPVSSSSWVGTWMQIDSLGAAVPEGQYKLYVDTSVGTLSRCFRLYDPCCSCHNPCCASCTVCADVRSITECCCKYELEFVSTCRTAWCWFPFFWGCGCSGCP